MAYRFVQEEQIGQAISRVVIGQINKALAEIDDPEIEIHETIHQVRKRCKKIRGVLRVIEPEFKEVYEYENNWFRDAARNLSGVRDAEALIETYDELMESYSEELNRRAFQSVRRGLTMRKQELVENGIDIEERLLDFKSAFEQARDRVRDWPLDQVDDGIVVDGMAKNYGRGRDAMREVLESPTVEMLHEWRKRTKYLWYHFRLLRDVWKPVMTGHRNAAKDLSDLLGDDHNLAVLRATLNSEPERFESLSGVDALSGLLERRREKLQSESVKVGKLLYAERRKAFRRRIGAYLGAWHVEI